MKYVGVDGCPYGWVAVILEEGREPRVQVFEHVSTLWEQHCDAQIILVDMPIGLPSAKAPVREVDTAARGLLGPRKSSVFSPPLREVLHCEDHAQANALSRQLCGKGISRQAWNIVGRIKELDSFLCEDLARAAVVYEAHPEVCYALLCGGPMAHYKKTLLGGLDRLGAVSRYCASAQELLQFSIQHFGRKVLGEDDVLDALVLAVCARGGKDGTAGFLPEQPPLDMCGLPMSIWFCSPDLDKQRNNDG